MMVMVLLMVYIMVASIEKSVKKKGKKDTNPVLECAVSASALIDY